MTQINAHLTFNGNCHEAMTFYKECFGGELSMQTLAGTLTDKFEKDWLLYYEKN